MIHLVEFQTPAGPTFINLPAVQAVQPHGPFSRDVAPTEEPRCFISLRSGAVILVTGTVEDTVKHLSWVAQQIERPARLIGDEATLDITAIDEVTPTVERLTLYQKHRASVATARAELERAKAEQARVSARPERT